MNLACRTLSTHEVINSVPHVTLKNKLMTLKYIYTTMLCLLVSFSAVAQNELTKTKQTIKVNKNVEIYLDATHTNVEVDTWNKNYVEIEAYIGSKKLSKEELAKALEAWDFDVDANENRINIHSKGSQGNWSNDISIKILDEESLEALSNMDINLNLEPLLEGLSSLESLQDLPETLKILRIPESPDGSYNMDFDFDKYQEDGEKYLDAWSKKYRKEYGEEYEEEMRDWAKSIKQSDLDNFEKEMTIWGEKFGGDIEKAIEEGFGEDFEKKMEKWGEDFGKQFEEKFAPAMEKWGEEFGKAFEEKMEEAFGDSKSKNRFEKSNKTQDLIKTIKIKMPKKAKLKLDVRHGELKMASVISNPDITISHGKFLANTIDGSDASINISYSNAAIQAWNEGTLKLNYASKTKIKTAKDLMLNAVSSNVDIENLCGNSVIDGSFGDLYVQNILDNFNNLNIFLENSDALLSLPKTINYNLYFKGNHSKLNKKTTNSKTIKHTPNDGNSNKTIVINAKYSNVIAE
ncbi:hypothetical protein [Lacinutrix jangbogonensis]|uniref:hypothetical protein n=1 Tax=Lacinutrix jangbogonensis TaxID=1469557 RepID=UPI000AC96938|nr:hypothetical protein [Lacinutrix jangbogonensis]